ncbi:MAG: alpha/beta fold hydrolase [Candidatus Latescibacterota bacterium]
MPAPNASAPAASIRLAEECVGFMARGEYDAVVTHFDSVVSAALPAGKLAETWKALLAQVGSFHSQTDVRTEKWRDGDIVFVTCQFDNFLIDVKFVFDAGQKISGLWFLPAKPPAEYQLPPYADKDAFNEEEVSVGCVKWRLPATLSIPARSGKVPAVVLVHGSGPQDRDESIGPNKPFCDLASGLASLGIAVLRYDKRTMVHALTLAAVRDSITVNEETIEDVLAAVEFLRGREMVDSNRMYVLGPSLGGMLIPRIGSLDRSIAGFILLAAPSRPLEDEILEQVSYLSQLDGQVTESEQADLDRITDQVARVKEPGLSVDTPSSDLPLGVPAKYWLDLRGYSPAGAAPDIPQPMLILQGERDYQVTMEDFRGWQAALSARNNIKFKSYPLLNHLFMEGQDKSAPDEYEKPGHVAAVVIRDIADWITAR